MARDALLCASAMMKKLTIGMDLNILEEVRGRWMTMIRHDLIEIV